MSLALHMFEFQRKLGAGSFGEVFLVKNLLTDSLQVIKAI